MVGEREIGDIIARIANSEAEIENLRERTHKHSSALTSATLLPAVVSDCRNRIEALEVGIAVLKTKMALIGAVTGTAAAIIVAILDHYVRQAH